MQHALKRTVITVASVGALLGAIAVAQADFGRDQDLSAAPVGESRTGKMTWYPMAGKGACGTDINAATEELVALPPELWTAANPNNDDLCKGVSVEVTYNGKTLTLPVKDKCLTCSAEHIDLSKPAFQKLADLDVGVVSGITWKLVDAGDGSTGGGSSSGDSAPGKPGAITRTGWTNNSVGLMWTDSEDDFGVTGYDLYLNGTKIGTSWVHRAAVTGLTLNTTYSFTVAARDKSGNVSPLSDPIEITLTGDSSGSVDPLGGSATDITNTSTGDSSTTGGSDTCGTAWNASQSYVPGDVVSYQGHKYKATYYANGAVPGDPTSWAVWHDDGVCGG